MEDRANALALEALRLFKARSFDEGANAYRRALMLPDRARVARISVSFNAEEPA